MKFISHLLRSSFSQNLPYSCVSDFEINRRGDHRSPVLQTRNFNRGHRKAKAFWGITGSSQKYPIGTRKQYDGLS